MKQPRFVTFTGIDAKTDLKRVKELSNRYSIEWGILFGGSLNNGQRYPDFSIVKNALELADEQDDPVRFAAHLCGFYAKRAMTQGIDPSEIYSVLGSDRFGRIQVNATKYSIGKLLQLHEQLQRPIIMQTRTNEFPAVIPKGLFFLHDVSGGKGKAPKVRPIQRVDVPFVGYAGGIGLHNVADVLGEIDAHNFWIDMESHIRTDDWLDLDKCEAICKAIWP